LSTNATCQQEKTEKRCQVGRRRGGSGRGPKDFSSNWRTAKIAEISRNVWDNSEGLSGRDCQQTEGRRFVKGRVGCPGNVVSNLFSALSRYWAWKRPAPARRESEGSQTVSRQNHSELLQRRHQYCSPRPPFETGQTTRDLLYLAKSLRLTAVQASAPAPPADPTNKTLPRSQSGLVLLRPGGLGRVNTIGGPRRSERS